MALDALFRLEEDDALFVVGRRPDGAPAGFLHFARTGSALSLSSMPRLRDTPNGFNEWLVCVAIEWARANGYPRVSLNFAPFAALLAPEAELKALQKAQRRGAERVARARARAPVGRGAELGILRTAQCCGDVAAPFAPAPDRFTWLAVSLGRLARRIPVRAGGWALYLSALALAPLSLVQACSAGGIGLLALLVSRRGAVLSKRERVGVVSSIAGLALLGISLAGGSAGGRPGSAAAVAAWLAASCARAATAAGPAADVLAPGAGLGVAAGVLYAAATSPRRPSCTEESRSCSCRPSSRRTVSRSWRSSSRSNGADRWRRSASRRCSRTHFRSPPG
jgi:lysylphosphatidylglycerol synthetase-like protein (DUF2156 family)